MVEAKGVITDLSVGVKNRKTKLIIEIENGSPADYEDFLNKDINITIKSWRNKRSINANRYCWELLSKLAYVLKKSKIDLYRAYIKEIPENSFEGCVEDKDVKRVCKLWQSRGIGWLTEVEDSKLEGCKNITYYQGSSSYDSVQMNVLIDLIIQDCQAVGIQTLTPREIEEMKQRWGYE